jgi:hypothetical protein
VHVIITNYVLACQPQSKFLPHGHSKFVTINEAHVTSPQAFLSLQFYHDSNIDIFHVTAMFPHPFLSCKSWAVTAPVSLMQILGNKSLKIKYLNPSTVFIATGPPEGLLTEDLEPSSIALTVQIVDTVTGAPVHRQVHKASHVLVCC